jgi:outer membrane receptor for ferrienterochelin and colicins
MKKIMLVIAFISPAIISWSQDSTKTIELTEVVVTGQYKPQSVRNSVYQVRVITKDRLQRQSPSQLQDVLNKELNLRFTNDVATGGSDMTMLGLKGQNIKILLDGIPVIGRQGVSNEISINQIDINSIERIEIVEGPMSVIYGADALGGVINIITKKTSPAKFSVTAKLQEESIGKEYGIKQGIHNQYVGLSYRNKHWEMGGQLGRNYFGGWKDSAIDRELSWHKKDQLNAAIFAAYKTGRFNIKYRLDGLDEIITNPGNFTQRQQDSGDTLARDQEYLSQRVMQQIQAGYGVNNNLSFQAQLAHTDYSRQVFSTTISKSTGDTRLDMTPGAQSEIDFKAWNIRGSAIYKLSDIFSFQPGVDINLESGKGERLKEGVNRVNDYAFFLTSEINIQPGISVRPGLRMIQNSVYDAPPVLPSINTRITLSKNLDLRLAYARGFRSPSVRELYFNFFDANHQIIGNPDLKAETSNSYTGSLNYTKSSDNKSQYTVSLSGFYNNVKDLIDFIVSPDDPNIYIYSNFSRSKTRGGNLTGSFRKGGLDLAAGVGVTGYYNEYVNADKSLPELQWSADANANAGYKFSKSGVAVNLFYKLTGSRPIYTMNGLQQLELTKAHGYHLADLVINKRFFHMITLNAGVKNLFDVTRTTSSLSATGVHTNNGIRNIGYGRSWFAGLVFNWEKN